VQARQSADSPANKSQVKKTTKKRKKARRVTTPLTIVLTPESVVRQAPQPPAPSAPSAQLVVDMGVPTVPTMPVVSRGSLSASRSSGGVRILPSGRPGGEASANASGIVISEFRVRGPSGANDEFIEIMNASAVDHTVTAAVTDGTGDGYGVAASDGITRC